MQDSKRLMNTQKWISECYNYAARNRFISSKYNPNYISNKICIPLQTFLTCIIVVIWLVSKRGSNTMTFHAMADTYLVAGDERSGESKSTGYTRSDFLRWQLKQTNGNNYVHSSFNKSKWSLIWFLKLSFVLFILQPRKRKTKRIYINQ